MITPKITLSLLDRLPQIKGRYRENVILANNTWFRVGGVADVVFNPANLSDLTFFITHCPKDIPITILGAMSNVLVRDGGIEGVTIRLTKGFNTVRIEKTDLYAAAGVLDQVVAQTAARHSIGGLEFLSGIPGSIGGALRMNAGAYGTEMKDVLIYADVLSPDGQCHRLNASQMGFSYRHCRIPEDWIFTGAMLRGYPESPSVVQARMDEIKQKRQDSQPTRGQTGGSTFANPPGQKAWQLIDAAGCAKDTCGGALISPKHCNFLMNNGKASASDIETLGESIRQKVKDHSGVDLEWEIRRLGRWGA
jgi:UDP-N-acetylmuramate dehydrogenase